MSDGFFPSLEPPPRPTFHPGCGFSHGGCCCLGRTAWGFAVPVDSMSGAASADVCVCPRSSLPGRKRDIFFCPAGERLVFLISSHHPPFPLSLAGRWRSQSVVWSGGWAVSRSTPQASCLTGVWAQCLDEGAEIRDSGGSEPG